jgi:hypothetical protein
MHDRESSSERECSHTQQHCGGSDVPRVLLKEVLSCDPRLRSDHGVAKAHSNDGGPSAEEVLLCDKLLSGCAARLRRATLKASPFKLLE